MNMNIKADRLKGGLNKLAQTASKNKDSVSGTVILVKPSDCYEEGNPRTDFDQALIESIADDFMNPAVGQLESIILYPADKDGKYRIQHGATRKRSGLIAESKDPSFRLKAIIDESLAKKDDLDNFFERGANNIKRDNMTLLDRANFIGSYMDKAKELGKPVTQGDIAKKLNLSGASYVSRLLKLREMTPEMAEVYNSGKIDDVEALSTLADIQKDNPELFANLISLPDLDRTTIRRAKKSGKLNIDEPSTPTEQIPAVVNSGVNVPKSSNVTIDTQAGSDEDVTTIPYVDYLFKTGRVNILVKPAADGVMAALETIFDHGINEEGSFTNAPVWKTENEAVSYGKEQLRSWAELIASDKGAVSLEEYQDATGYLHWLKTGNKPSNTPEQEPSARKPKPSQLNAVIFVDVNGEEGILLLKVPKEYSGTEGENLKTNGFVYVQIGSEVRVVKEGEFVFKSVSYRE